MKLHKSILFENYFYRKTYIKLLYQSYKGQLSKSLEEPFDMKVCLYLEMNKFQYEIGIISYSYNRVKNNEEKKSIWKNIIINF